MRPVRQVGRSLACADALALKSAWVVVLAHGSESDWNLPPASLIVSIVLSRSRVDLARRSNFQTTIMSPGRIWSSMVGGWALAEDGVQRVAIYVDKQFVTFATLGGDRPDIAKAFPAFANAGKSGWNVVVDLSSMIEGDHEMVVQVKSKGGSVHDFPAIPFKIVP